VDKPNVSGPFPDPEVPDLDAEGRAVPPWVKYPNLRRGSMGWRMGPGEKYVLDRFAPWWRQLAEADREQYLLAYPAPEEWRGFLNTRGADRHH
jgi:hypothetical protein